MSVFSCYSCIWPTCSIFQCSVTCGAGSSQRDVICVSELGTTHPSIECTDPKPRNTKRCAEPACPSWAYTRWSKVRSFRCWGCLPFLCLTLWKRKGLYELESKEECRVGLNLTASVHFLNFVLCTNFIYKIMNLKLMSTTNVGKHGFSATKSCMNVFQCSTSCGVGVQQRHVLCRLGHSDIVPNDLCLQEKRPRSARRCQDKPCFDYMWNTGPWQNVCAHWHIIITCIYKFWLILLTSSPGINYQYWRLLCVIDISDAFIHMSKLNYQSVWIQVQT